MNKFSAAEAAAAIAAGKLKSEALVAACLERVFGIDISPRANLLLALRDAL